MSGNSPNSDFEADSDSAPAVALDPSWADQPWLRSVVVARLGSAEGVDDVLQEVRVAAIEQKAPIREPGAFRGWLLQVAVRQSLLFLRRMGRYRRLLTSAADHGTAATLNQADDGLSWLLQSERRALIRQALAELDGRDRELLILKYLEGWSYQQIADARGSTLRSVENRVCRARGRLRQRLQQLNIVNERGEDFDDE